MDLRELLGTELPIIQAPMAGVQGSALAVAVSNSGGLGSLPCAVLGPQTIGEQIKAIKAQTSRPFNVNFFCHAAPAPDSDREAAWRAALSPYYRELGIDAESVPTGTPIAPVNPDAVAALADSPPAVVSFHFGLPAPDVLQQVRALGCRIVSSATTVDEARWLEAQGVDAIIAQGLEAGGHRGMFMSDDLSRQAGTFALLPQVVRAVRVPVIAAGGIGDARGVAAAMALGAAGVQVGTAYLLCPEATTGPLYRAALGSDAARHTAVTNLFTGHPARAIMNRVMRELGPMNSAVPGFPAALRAVVPLRAQAERRGSADFSAFWCGQNATGCRKIPAAALTHELAAGL